MSPEEKQKEVVSSEEAKLEEYENLLKMAFSYVYKVRYENGERLHPGEGKRFYNGFFIPKGFVERIPKLKQLIGESNEDN